jgi:hypothetical protein
MSPLNPRVVLAIGAWGSLLIYAWLMMGFFDALSGQSETAASPPVLDEGLTQLAAAFATAVVGVIVGLTGVALANQALTTPRASILSAGLGATSWVGKAAPITYLLVYAVVAVAGFALWIDHGTALTPEFIRTQVSSAVGILAAMAVVGADT